MHHHAGRYVGASNQNGPSHLQLCSSNQRGVNCDSNHHLLLCFCCSLSSLKKFFMCASAFFLAIHNIHDSAVREPRVKGQGAAVGAVSAATLFSGATVTRQQSCGCSSCQGNPCRRRCSSPIRPDSIKYEAKKRRNKTCHHPLGFSQAGHLFFY